MKCLDIKKQIHVCGLSGCSNQASTRWDFHNNHFCCEDHLIKWIRNKTEQEKHWPMKGGRDWNLHYHVHNVDSKHPIGILKSEKDRVVTIANLVHVAVVMMTQISVLSILSNIKRGIHCLAIFIRIPLQTSSIRNG